MLGNAIMNGQNHSLLAEAVRPRFARILVCAAVNVRVLTKDASACLRQVRAYGRSVELAPLNPASYVNLAHAYRDSDQLAEAASQYRAAGRLITAGSAVGDYAKQPTFADGLRIRTATLLPRIIKDDASMLADRAAFIHGVQALREAADLRLSDPATEVGGVITFNLAYMGMNDREIHRAVSRLYEAADPTLLFVAPHCFSPGVSTTLATAARAWTAETTLSGSRKHWLMRAHPRDAGERVKLGFISANLKDHTIGKLFTGLVTRASVRLGHACLPS